MSKIDTPQISAEERNLREHLGDFSFEKLAQFFAQTGLYALEKNMCRKEHSEKTETAQMEKVRIVAFMTRRCYALALEYMKVFSFYCKSNIEPDFLDASISEENHTECSLYITDFALVAMADEMVLYYLKCGKMPTIDIVDELLIHGRAVNNLLSDLEERLIERLNARFEEKVYTVPLEEMQYDILEQLQTKIRILVYAQNDRILLLYPRYRLQLESVCTLEPNRWRHLSKNISAALAQADSSNVAYSWVLRVKKSSDSYAELEKLIFNKQKTEENRFTQVLFDNDPDRVVYLHMYDTLRSPKAIGTIRVRKSPISKDLLLIPYMLIDAVPSEKQNTMFSAWQNQMKEFSSIIPQEDFVSQRRKQEINSILLGKMIFEDWLNEILEKSAGLVKEEDFTLDSQQFLSNFMVQRLDDESLKDCLLRWMNAMIESQQLLHLPLLKESRERISGQIKEVLARSETIWNLKEECSKEKNTMSEFEIFSLNKILENAVADVGYEAETDAFNLKRENVDVIDRNWMFRGGKKLSAREMFDKVLAEIPSSLKKEKIVLDYVAAGLVYMMDIGTVAMAPEHRCEINQDEEDFINIHAGEQALFIKPSRYEKYMTVLRLILEAYEDQPDLIQPEIKRFVRAAANNPEDEMDICKEFGGQMQPDEIAKELYDFIEQLEKAGQDLKGWDFPLTDFGCRLNQKKMTLKGAWEILKAQVDYLSIYRRASM